MRRARAAFPVATALLWGCASTSLIADGALRPEPYRALLARVEWARGIRAEGPVEARVVSREELRGELRRSIESEWTPQELEDYQQGLVAVGLWPGDRAVVDETVAVMTEQIAGLYLPQERAVLVVRDAATPFSVRFASFLARRDFAREFVLAHELVHALQHRQYPALFDPALAKGRDDVAVALQAAIEGDAVHYGLLALPAALPEPEDLAASAEEQVRSEREGALAEAPALLRLTLLFPYTGGYALSLREGLRLLDAPPASSEQVLHPDKRHEAFLAVDLDPLREALPAGCRALSTNGAGELYLSVLFRDLAPETPAAVWEGWDGDAYLAAACAGRREFLWLTAWDSEGDADEFERAYRGIAPEIAERAGLSGPPVATRAGREVWIATPGLAGLRAALADVPRVRVSRLEEVLPASPSQP